MRGGARSPGALISVGCITFTGEAFSHECTKTIIIIQEVCIPHNRRVLQTWNDRVERLIAREIDPEGMLVSEAVVSEEIGESRCDFEAEILAADEHLEEAEILTEKFDDE
jgi:hypothetical protein